MEDFKRARLKVSGTLGPDQGGGGGTGGSAGGGGGVPKGDLKVGDEIEFQFNPKEYSIQKSANIPKQQTASASGGSAQQYTGHDPRTLTFEAFFDGWREKPEEVKDKVDFLLKCCSALPESVKARKPAMPIVTLSWGQALEFQAMVKSVNVKYTLFKPNGLPVRAVCNVALEEHIKEEKAQNPTSGGLATRRSHRVVAGDSLPSIAYQEYGEPALWRAIAELNGIDDPTRLPNGAELLVPEADEARALR